MQFEADLKPTGPSDTRLLDLFRASLRQFLNPAHPLLSLAAKIDWTHFDAAFAEYDSTDMGAPAKAVRLMVGLHYLKYAFNELDESLLEKWVENPYWHGFCGFDTVLSCAA
ncbi:MAG: transposase [Planctomycetaceae bacterium]|nr:transposase [Planctomycetaceae bacterium]